MNSSISCVPAVILLKQMGSRDRGPRPPLPTTPEKKEKKKREFPAETLFGLIEGRRSGKWMEQHMQRRFYY